MQNELKYYQRYLRSYWRTEIFNTIIFVLALGATVVNGLIGGKDLVSASVSNILYIGVLIIIGITIVVMFGKVNRQNRAVAQFKQFMAKDDQQLSENDQSLFNQCKHYYQRGRQLDKLNMVIALGVVCGYILISM
ncbi:hypothetical protein HC026_00645 [Lactobacillus sp. LC28-10]|uniref:DUF3899 domain-containing protein n=1 Tax=Secundilactobacillus angelensis TaxID=2722706 RepID=A0ABX1KVR1_9LACO|nr:hypothetical protein [Secundilactobacillus angelensis]MCH5461933.1 hypothetical protein [Secundilactobacillus angelensis]NLR17420.1 hypothetical protein [Secundilactobacillus angelensis]